MLYPFARCPTRTPSKEMTKECRVLLGHEQPDVVFQPMHPLVLTMCPTRTLRPLEDACREFNLLFANR